MNITIKGLILQLKLTDVSIAYLKEVSNLRKKPVILNRLSKPWLWRKWFNPLNPIMDRTVVFWYNRVNVTPYISMISFKIRDNEHFKLCQGDTKVSCNRMSA